MKTYRIRQISPVAYVVTLLVTWCAGFILFFIADFALGKISNEVSTIIIMSFIVALPYFLTRFIAYAETEISLDDKGLTNKWLTMFFLTKRPDYEIKWDDVAEYRFRTNTYYWHWVEILLKDGYTRKIYHNRTTVDKDDYLDFLNDFKLRIEEFNAREAVEEKEAASPEVENESTIFVAEKEATGSEVSEKAASTKTRIKTGKAIYETTGGVLLAGFAIVLIISFPVLLFLPVQNPESFGLLGACCLGAMVYLFEFFSHKRKKRKGKDTQNVA